MNQLTLSKALQLFVNNIDMNNLPGSIFRDTIRPELEAVQTIFTQLAYQIGHLLTIN